MPMLHNGLLKLIEECGECVQAASVVIANGDADTAPGREGSLRGNLEDEIADVLAAADYVIDEMGLDRLHIEARRAGKLARFRQWANE